MLVGVLASTSASNYYGRHLRTGPCLLNGTTDTWDVGDRCMFIEPAMSQKITHVDGR